MKKYLLKNNHLFDNEIRITMNNNLLSEEKKRKIDEYKENQTRQMWHKV